MQHVLYRGHEQAHHVQARRGHPLPRGRQLDPFHGPDHGRRQKHRHQALVDAGRACSAYQNEHLRNLPCRRIQVDEIWAFVHAKAKNVATAKAAPRAPAISGPGRPFARTRSWCRAGSSALGIASSVGLRRRSAQPPGEPRPAHQRRPQAVSGGRRGSLRRRYRLRGPAEAVRNGAEAAKGSATARPVHRHEARGDHRQPRSRAHQHELRRAPEPHHANEHASVHAADQCIPRRSTTTRPR